jgi:hypothetical protein
MKRAKCDFGPTEVSYLGHVISSAGVAMDQNKVHAFLGLTGYYHRFICDYGAILQSLTKLLHKGGFVWNTEAEDAFCARQRALTLAPVLQLPDFERPFTVECDVSGVGFGVVLHQGTGPVTYFSRPIAARHAKLAAYERELTGLVHVMATDTRIFGATLF